MGEDTIYRQAAIDLFPNDTLEWDTKGGYIAPHLARKMIEELPPAEPRPRGQWLPDNRNYYEERFVCSVCKRSYEVDTCMGEPTWHFCPGCGADMREGGAG